MNLTEFEDIVNMSEKLLEQTKNNIMTVDEFGYWTEGVLLVEKIVSTSRKGLASKNITSAAVSLLF